VSVFRPSVRVTGPDGREWEVYAYRIRLPERRRPEHAFETAVPDLRAQAATGLLDAAFWLLGELVHLAVLVLWHVPRTALRALGSDEWTVEAVSWLPHRTVYAWRTTREYRGHVLAQVEGQLARGETPTPGHATYLGATI
jgi:hypothetical protein